MTVYVENAEVWRGEETVLRLNLRMVNMLHVNNGFRIQGQAESPVPE